jgi:hypothetical protein
MTNDRNNTQQPYSDTEGEENSGNARQEQFNELSELSLEARMNVADRLGIPVNDIGEAVALGTIRDRDESTESANDRMEEENERQELNPRPGGEA